MSMSMGQQRGGAPGHGRRHKRGTYDLAFHVDGEMRDAVRAKAGRDGTSLPEAARTLIEWGLEAEEMQ